MLLLLNINVTAQSTDLRCVSVETNGDITLDWMAYNDTNNSFVSYHIYRSSNLSGPYSVIGSQNLINNTSYSDVSINGQKQSFYYYIKIELQCASCNNIITDTLQSMLLTGTVSQGSFANFSWNKISSYPIPSNTKKYDVRKAYPIPAGYNLFTQRIWGNESFRDTAHICDNNIGYYVELKDQSGCVSRSSIDTAHYFDTKPPQKELLDSVSVKNNTGHAVMGWKSNPDQDTRGYYIIIPLGSNQFQVIDTLYGINNNYYEYMNSDAANQIETYAVIAFDSCGNYVNNNFNFHSTMHLASKVDICEKSIELTWNKYRTFNSNTTTEYNIYASKGGGTYNKIGSTIDTTFKHANILTNTTYYYYIQAVDNNGAGPFTSTSSIDSIRTVFNTNSQFTYLQYATVKDSSHIALSCYVDTAADIKAYKIERTLDTLDGFTTISTVSPPPGQFFKYIDADVDASKNSYIYRVSVVNACGMLVYSSNIAKTILLNGEASDNVKLNVRLNWSKYQDWNGNVKSYEIYRKFDGSFDLSPIAVINSGKTGYIDDVSTIIRKINGKVCYKIKAVEEAPSFDSLNPSTSSSNIVCVSFQPVVFIPNAFKPNGRNRIFKPVLTLASTHNYSMLIFNRWGERVFHSEDKNIGWNGVYQGKNAQTGVYVYVIQFQSAKGKHYERKGTVTLLR